MNSVETKNVTCVNAANLTAYLFQVVTEYAENIHISKHRNKVYICTTLRETMTSG